MKYEVESGDYKTVIDRPTAYQAALDAIGLLQHKKVLPELAKVTTVSGGGATVYFKTKDLTQHHGMNYEPENQVAENGKADQPQVVKSL